MNGSSMNSQDANALHSTSSELQQAQKWKDPKSEVELCIMSIRVMESREISNLFPQNS